MTGLQHSTDSGLHGRTFAVRPRADRTGRWSMHPPKGCPYFSLPFLPFFFFIEIFNTANVVKSIFMIRLWLDGIWTLIPGSARRFHRHRGSANPQRMPSQQSMSSKQSILIQCLHVLVCVCVCVCACVSRSVLHQIFSASSRNNWTHAWQLATKNCNKTGGKKEAEMIQSDSKWRQTDKEQMSKKSPKHQCLSKLPSSYIRGYL